MPRLSREDRIYRLLLKPRKIKGTICIRSHIHVIPVRIGPHILNLIASRLDQLDGLDLPLSSQLISPSTPSPFPAKPLVGHINLLSASSALQDIMDVRSYFTHKLLQLRSIRSVKALKVSVSAKFLMSALTVLA